MEFGAFERLVLRVLFETPEPLTTPHIAYLAGIPIERAERYLGRMVEQGTLVPQLGANEVIEYVFPGRRKMEGERRIASRGWNALTGGPSPQERARMPLGAQDDGDEADMSEDSEDGANAATAVLLSVLVPGAGHIYAGRSGAGVAWMATTLAGYACCLLPGLFLHGLCLVSAAHTREVT
jgi:hypothetical protein